MHAKVQTFYSFILHLVAINVRHRLKNMLVQPTWERKGWLDTLENREQAC
jgi:hypothetical protein